MVRDRLIVGAWFIFMGLSVGLLVFAAQVAAQTPAELQRQIERIERDIATNTADMKAAVQEAQRQFQRLAALEREVELVRIIIFAIMLSLVGNGLASLATFRRVAAVQKTLNGNRT